MTTREQKELLLIRILYMAVIWLLLRLANWAIAIIAIVNYLYRWANKGDGNEALTKWGRRLANWMLTATAFLTSVSEAKPWPFRDWRDD